MAYQRFTRLITELMILLFHAYISLSVIGCIRADTGGNKDMPFQTLSKDEFLKTEIVNVSSYGAIGDGIKSDSLAISQAISYANDNEVLLPSGTYKIDNDITIPSNVSIRLNNGAKFSIDEGVTVTINGKLDAGLYQIFSGDGTVSIARGACEYLIPQWWGALGDGSNDDTSAIQAALTASGLKVRKVFLPSGVYNITGLTLQYGSQLIGSGKLSTTLKVTDGGNGIDVTRVVNSEIYEGAKLSDFRIYSTTTPLAGTGIYVNGDRSVDIENVWVGAWHPEGSAYGYGFDKGIEIKNQPAYYTTIRRCALFRNTYGIYVYTGANESRILESEVWFGEYSVYAEPASGIKICDNSFEGYTVCGMYLNGDEPVVENNRFESSGVQPIIFGASCKRAIISGVTGVTGLGDDNIVLDNSSYPNTHQINRSHVPIGDHNVGFSYPAGLLKSEYYNYHQTDMIIEALSGDLKIRSPLTKVVSVQSPLNIDKGELSTPMGGYGSYFNNLMYWSNDVTHWNASGTITRTANTEVAPDGTTTASLMIPSTNDDYVYYVVSKNGLGKLYQFSVWLKTDVAHYAKLYLTKDNAARGYKNIYIDTQWRRYHINIAVDASSTYVNPWLMPKGTGYRTYMWGGQLTEGTPVTGTDDSGVDDKTTKLVDTGTNFKTSGIDVGGQVMVTTGSAASIADITSINSILNFTIGDGTEPSVGDTVTGGTSGATGTVAEVIIAGGTFAGGDAAGTIEVAPVTYTFEAEALAWTDSSATVASVNHNCILVGSFGTSYGGKNDVDKGDTYYAWSSVQRSPKPFMSTLASTTFVSTSPSAVMPNALINGSIKVKNGYIHEGSVYDTLDSNLTVPIGWELLVLNPSADRTIITTNMQNGQIWFIKNISASYKIAVLSLGDIPASHSALILKGSDGTVRFLGVFPSDLTPTSSPVFTRINGAVSALSNASTIACNMNLGNVFTLATTEAVGAVQINASNGVAGQKVTFIIADDATGGHVVTFGTNFKSSGTLTGTASKSATVDFVYDGTSWYEVNRTTGL